MDELFKPEERIEVEEGWYACHPLERDDIVLVKFSYRARPILKLARVIPGDKFELRVTSKSDGVNLFVNGQILKTPKGVAYLFTGGRAKMLHLYEQSFKGVMPLDTCFVFGTQPGGSLDSSKFGPVTKGAIVGRVKKSFKTQ